LLFTIASTNVTSDRATAVCNAIGNGDNLLSILNN